MNAQGLDVSHWNGEGDFKVAKANGISFVFIRAGSINHTTGGLYTDHLFHKHTQAALEAELPFGFYWYFRPYHSPERQAEYFLSLARGYKHKLPLVCDAEYSVGLTPKQNANSITQFLSRVENATNTEPIIYTRQSWWDPSVTAGTWSRYPLWAARYSDFLTSPWSDGRFVFRDWQTWDFWQYSADGNGRAALYGFTQGDPDMDINRYNGTVDDLYKRYNIDGTAPPPTGCSSVLKVLVDGLRIRSGPSTRYSIIGNLSAMTEVEAMDIAGADAWVKHDKGWSCVELNGRRYMDVVK